MVVLLIYLRIQIHIHGGRDFHSDGCIGIALQCKDNTIIRLDTNPVAAVLVRGGRNGRVGRSGDFYARQYGSLHIAHSASHFHVITKCGLSGFSSIDTGIDLVGIGIVFYSYRGFEADVVGGFADVDGKFARLDYAAP